ncbi:PAS domain-containing protein [Desulfobacula phenolica]|uniref:PAS fold-containing protein n=1 Tax=Desulfobacula phenolica TaxID=90732 RepID=A0A1H2KD46_9BACT|nr:PAS domain-containing protein [Desulfobacula phenolica]SDU66215.1 hypothetical protein SAMN04487931_1305 [Desulfobacula phenolica]
MEFLPPPSYKLVRVNPSLLNTLGESSLDILGRSLVNYVESSFKIQFQKRIKKVLSIGLPNIFHMRLIPVGEPSIEVRAIHFPVVDETGRIIRIGGHGRIVKANAQLSVFD